MVLSALVGTTGGYLYGTRVNENPAVVEQVASNEQEESDEKPDYKIEPVVLEGIIAEGKSLSSSEANKREFGEKILTRADGARLYLFTPENQAIWYVMNKINSYEKIKTDDLEKILISNMIKGNLYFNTLIDNMGNYMFGFRESGNYNLQIIARIPGTEVALCRSSGYDSDSKLDGGRSVLMTINYQMPNCYNKIKDQKDVVFTVLLPKEDKKIDFNVKL